MRSSIMRSSAKILIAFAFSLAGPLVAEEPADFSVKLDVVKQELHPDFCWFHPRVAAVPGAGKDGLPLVVLTIQKHLVADDHYSGLHYMTTADLGKTWTGPKLPPRTGPVS